MTHVLVADDRTDIRMMYRLALGKAGYDVSEASDGDEATALLARLDFDAVLLDIMMPGANGIEVCRTIRKTMGSRVPVLIVSALTRPLDKALAFDAGATGYIEKPVSPRALVARIEHLTRAARPPAA